MIGNERRRVQATPGVVEIDEVLVLQALKLCGADLIDRGSRRVGRVGLEKRVVGVAFERWVGRRR